MGPVEIGDNLSTGPHVKILGPRHAITGYENIDVNKKTIIGNNVWISTDSIILSGVTIGDNAVIGPASLVTKDVPPGAYVAGNPARDLTRVTSFKSAEKSND
ncbi:MAG: hypothetical protein JXR70_02280 [Spirochaetales bacterium]|nr:hypothetical protein [Spirochaetales bacterium]